MSLSSRAIFDLSRSRVDASPRRHDEPSFAFYDRCAEPVIGIVRAKLEEWFANYPAGHARRDLLGRLRDGDQRQWDSAVWELYVYESLRRQGFSVTPNPPLAHTPRRVDFVATRAIDRLYVECTVVSHSDVTANERSVVGALEAAIDASGIADYWLDLDFAERGKEAFDPQGFVAELVQWIATLNVDEVDAIAQRGRDFLPRFEKRMGDWTPQVWALPRGRDLRGRADLRPLGILPGADLDGSLWVAARAKLELKAEAYGELDAPYIIALNAPEAWPREEQLGWAVHGPGALTKSWEREGFLLRADGPEYPGVAGVLIGVSIQPHTFPRLAPTLYENPAATLKVPESVLWNRVQLDEKGARRTAGRPPHKLFEVEASWPGEPWRGGTP